MYGKSFQRMYTGSMVGSGSHVYAVWGYCITNADSESHTVDLNPVVLSTIIGDSLERIQAAIEYLEQPDLNSHNKEQEGRRIVKTTGFEYFVVSHEDYRNVKNNEELRQYFRENKRLNRLSKNVQDCLGMSQDPASVSVLTLPEDFCSFYAAYPKKQAKQEALKAWKQLKNKPALDYIIAAVNKQKQSTDWKKDNGKYIPLPASWLRAGRWDDEVRTNEPRKSMI